MFRAILLMLFTFVGQTLWAQDNTSSARFCSSDKWGVPICIDPETFNLDLCLALVGTAERHGLNPGFFTRLIFQESRFDPNAHSHANAQGIAQFIPSTAKLRGLSDPWNPAEALDESARYLSELVTRFGNEGLAAAAYNAGEDRIRRFKAKTAGLPRETWNYVQIITKTQPRLWRDAPPQNHDFSLSKKKSFMPACLELTKKRAFSYYEFASDPSPWGVLVASGNSKGAARKFLQKRTKACRGLFEGETLHFKQERSNIFKDKTFFKIHAGFGDKDSAIRFCKSMQKRACFCATEKLDG